MKHCQWRPLTAPALVDWRPFKRMALQVCPYCRVGEIMKENLACAGLNIINDLDPFVLGLGRLLGGSNPFSALFRLGRRFNAGSALFQLLQGITSGGIFIIHC